MKYYAMYVRAGNEEKIIACIRTMIPSDLYGSCISLTRIMKKKIHGEWLEIREKLLPGYLFITTDEIAGVYRALRMIPEYIRVLGKDAEGPAGAGCRDLRAVETESGGSIEEKDIEKINAEKKNIGKRNIESIETEGNIFPLSEKEEEWVRQLASGGKLPRKGHGAACGQAGGEIGLSEVTFDENDKVVIVSGPLKDMEGYVKKINLHKRVADVQVEFMHQEIVLQLGIEVVHRK